MAATEDTRGLGFEKIYQFCFRTLHPLTYLRLPTPLVVHSAQTMVAAAGTSDVRLREALTKGSDIARCACKSISLRGLIRRPSAGQPWLTPCIVGYFGEPAVLRSVAVAFGGGGDIMLRVDGLGTTQRKFRDLVESSGSSGLRLFLEDESPAEFVARLQSNVIGTGALAGPSRTQFSIGHTHFLLYFAGATAFAAAKAAGVQVTMEVLYASLLTNLNALKDASGVRSGRAASIAAFAEMRGASATAQRAFDTTLRALARKVPGGADGAARGETRGGGGAAAGLAGLDEATATVAASDYDDDTPVQLLNSLRAGDLAAWDMALPGSAVHMANPRSNIRPIHPDRVAALVREDEAELTIMLAAKAVGAAAAAVAAPAAAPTAALLVAWEGNEGPGLGLRLPASTRGGLNGGLSLGGLGLASAPAAAAAPLPPPAVLAPGDKALGRRRLAALRAPGPGTGAIDAASEGDVLARLVLLLVDFVLVAEPTCAVVGSIWPNFFLGGRPRIQYAPGDRCGSDLDVKVPGGAACFGAVATRFPFAAPAAIPGLVVLRSAHGKGKNTMRFNCELDGASLPVEFSNEDYYAAQSHGMPDLSVTALEMRGSGELQHTYPGADGGSVEQIRAQSLRGELYVVRPMHVKGMSSRVAKYTALGWKVFTVLPDHLRGVEAVGGGAGVEAAAPDSAAAGLPRPAAAGLLQPAVACLLRPAVAAVATAVAATAASPPAARTDSLAVLQQSAAAQLVVGVGSKRRREAALEGGGAAAAGALELRAAADGVTVPPPVASRRRRPAQNVFVISDDSSEPDAPLPGPFPARQLDAYESGGGGRPTAAPSSALSVDASWPHETVGASGVTSAGVAASLFPGSAGAPPARPRKAVHLAFTVPPDPTSWRHADFEPKSRARGRANARELHAAAAVLPPPPPCDASAPHAPLAPALLWR